MFPVPTSVFLTKGIGIHRHQLTSFELALREADIEQQNLVSISSILRRSSFPGWLVGKCGSILADCSSGEAKQARVH